jgi:hypothetical protein
VDLFGLAASLVAITPLPFTARAWWIVSHDLTHGSGRLIRTVLYLNSASALLFVFTTLLASSESITQGPVWRISVSNFCLCACITVLSGVKIRHRIYRAVFISSVILTVGWLILGTLH